MLEIWANLFGALAALGIGLFAIGQFRLVSLGARYPLYRDDLMKQIASMEASGKPWFKKHGPGQRVQWIEPESQKVTRDYWEPTIKDWRFRWKVATRYSGYAYYFSESGLETDLRDEISKSSTPLAFDSAVIELPVTSKFWQWRLRRTASYRWPRQLEELSPGLGAPLSYLHRLLVTERDRFLRALREKEYPGGLSWDLTYHLTGILETVSAIMGIFASARRWRIVAVTGATAALLNGGCAALLFYIAT